MLLKKKQQVLLNPTFCLLMRIDLKGVCKRTNKREIVRGHFLSDAQLMEFLQSCIDLIDSTTGFAECNIPLFVCSSVSSGAEGAPAELCGWDQHPARPRLRQGGPPWQAGGTDQVQSQRLESSHRSRRCFVWCTCGVQHGMVSVCSQLHL